MSPRPNVSPRPNRPDCTLEYLGAQDHRTRSSTVNKSPSESMSFITEVICKFIFTDVHMRNNYRPNRGIE